MEKYSSSTDLTSVSNAVLIFTGPTCGQCKMVKPGLIKDAASHPEVNLIEVDTGTDEGMELASQYGVKLLPTAVVLHSGTPNTTLAGAGQVNMRKILASL